MIQVEDGIRPKLDRLVRFLLTCCYLTQLDHTDMILFNDIQLKIYQCTVQAAVSMQSWMSIAFVCWSPGASGTAHNMGLLLLVR